MQCRALGRDISVFKITAFCILAFSGQWAPCLGKQNTYGVTKSPFRDQSPIKPINPTTQCYRSLDYSYPAGRETLAHHFQGTSQHSTQQVGIDEGGVVVGELHKVHQGVVF